MKLVLDCNVIISAGLTEGVCRKVLLQSLEKHTVCVSEPILFEYKAVISRPKFKAAERYLYSLLEIICELAELVEPKQSNVILPDPSDIIYLDAALSGKAKYLITGNIKDFPGQQYENTNVILPSKFLELE